MGQVYDVPVTGNTAESVQQNGLYVGRINYVDTSIITNLYIGSSVAGVKCVAGVYYSSSSTHHYSFGVTAGSTSIGNIYISCIEHNVPFRTHVLQYNANSKMFTAGDGFSGLNKILDSGISLYDDTPNALTNIGYPELELAVTGESNLYPIIYDNRHCSVNGPALAKPGSNVVLEVIPNTGYNFQGSATTVIDSEGNNIPYIIQDNIISFTFPNI